MTKNVRKFFQNNEFPPFRQDDSGERKLEVTAPRPGFGHFRNSGASIFDNPGPREQFSKFKRVRIIKKRQIFFRQSIKFPIKIMIKCAHSLSFPLIYLVAFHLTRYKLTVSSNKLPNCRFITKHYHGPVFKRKKTHRTLKSK
jgi:hypothetical protein